MTELLVQRAILRCCTPSGHVRTSVVVRDPLPLTHGKSAAAIFAAPLEFFPTLRQLGHQGIAIQHYAFDRAMHSPLFRMFRQHHAALADEAEPELAEGQGNPHIHPPALLEWVVDTPCCNHDVHNSLKWALFTYMQDEDLLKDVWVVIESLRNGFSLLQAELPRWLATKVKFVDEADAFYHPDDATALWTAVGADHSWVSTIVEYGLCFRDGRLHVNACHREDGNLWEVLSGVVLYSQRFTKFSDSRWCTLGKSCRTLVFALLLGMGDLVQAVLDDPTTSNYHIGGFQRLTARVKHFVSMAAMCSYPCDCLLQELLEDDRVALHFAEYKSLLAEEMQWLLSLPHSVWVALAELGDTSGQLLRAEAIAAASVSLGFIDTQIWRRAQSPPWQLAVGDIGANLVALVAQAEPPPESTARKVWALATQGFNMAQLEAGVALLLDLGWSSATVEQQHASATCVQRSHKTYGMASICARALVHTARLFFTSPVAETKVGKLECAVRKTMSRRPQSFGPRQLLFQEVDGSCGGQATRFGWPNHQCQADATAGEGWHDKVASYVPTFAS